MIGRALARLRAEDPGWIRARAAARVLLAVAVGAAVASGVLALAGGPAAAALVGGVAALTATLTVPPGPPRARAAHVGRVTVATGVSAAAAAAAAPWPWLADALFVVVMGAAAWASRWGPVGTPAGMAAFMAHAVARLLALHPPAVPWAALAAAAGGLGAAFVGLVLLPAERPDTSLRRLLPALEARTDVLVATIVETLANGPDERGRERILERLAGAQEVALLVDGALDQLAPPDADRLRESVLRVEVLAEHLVWSVNTRAEHAPAPAEAAHLARCWRDGPAPLQDPDRLLFLSEGAGPATTAHVLARLALGRRALARFRSLGAPVADRAPDSAPPAAPPPPTPAARKVVQACLAGAVAIALGRLLSPVYWEFAVMGAFFVILTTPFRGAAVRRAVDRTLGTALGVGLGLGLGALLGGHGPVEIVALVVLLFAAYWLLQVSHAWMMLLLTAVTALVYDLLGRFDASVLFVRLSETALGALIGGLVAWFVLPSTTRAALDPARAAPPPAPGNLADGEGPIADILRAIDARLVTWWAFREAGRLRG